MLIGNIMVTDELDGSKSIAIHRCSMIEVDEEMVVQQLKVGVAEGVKDQ